MKVTNHMSINLEGLLRNYKDRKINIMTDDDGKELTDHQARSLIQDLQAQGHKLMSSSSECEGFDPFGGGCPGHEVKEEKDHG